MVVQWADHISKGKYSERDSIQRTKVHKCFLMVKASICLHASWISYVPKFYNIIISNSTTSRYACFTESKEIIRLRLRNQCGERLAPVFCSGIA